MRHLTVGEYMAGVWGLHISSYVVSSIPYLQAISLILAIGVSLITIYKITKHSDRDHEKKPKSKPPSQ